MDAKDHNCWIVTRNGEYLQAREESTGNVIWSRYIFDSCPIWNRKQAWALAQLRCGKVIPFNHITGEWVK